MASFGDTGASRRQLPIATASDPEVWRAASVAQMHPPLRCPLNEKLSWTGARRRKAIIPSKCTPGLVLLFAPAQPNQRTRMMPTERPHFQTPTRADSQPEPLRAAAPKGSNRIQQRTSATKPNRLTHTIPAASAEEAQGGVWALF